MDAFKFDGVSDEDARMAMEGFARREPYRALPVLLGAAESARAAVSQAAIQALDEAVGLYPNLKESLRPERLAVWRGFTKPRVLDLLAKNEDAFGLAIACSFLPDGYVREAAVRKLTRMRDARVLPYLMLRSCDWVSQVGFLAEGEARWRIPEASIETLADCFRPFLVLEGASGVYPTRVKRIYLDQLLQRPGLLAAIRRRATSKKARWLLEKALLGPDETWEEVMRLSASRRNPVNWAATARQIRKLDLEVQKDLLDDLSSSRHRGARLLSLEIADKLDQVAYLEKGLMDRNWRVRNDARFYLAKRGVKDFSEIYRAALPNPAAVAGLGEVAPEKALAELLVYVDDPSIPVRKNAILALGQREYREAEERISAHLSDSSSSVVKAAIKALGKLGVVFSSDEILPLLEDPLPFSGLDKVRQKAVLLITRWDCLAVVLKLARRGTFVPDPNIVLHRWLGKGHRDLSGPSALQLERAREEFDYVKHHLRPDIATALQRELKYWSERLKGAK